ncbi:G protein-coupled receptor 137Ba-like isoform X2 [Diadema antillarum]|uniref:G protein-coupled receptor 137Ba-like n=2 Tax=Diadema antillarum TaxID=105358 RepID=UPI003A84C1CC
MQARESFMAALPMDRPPPSGPGWVSPLPVTTRAMQPIIEADLERSLAITFIILYGLLFVIIYVQLFLILYYGHKRFSYQTVFLFLCLFWSALRTTLFSFYILNAGEVDELCFVLYWLLLGFPVCLQFTSLCLLILYFAQVILKARIRYEPDQHHRRYKWRLRLAIVLLPLIFTLINLISGILIKVLSSEEGKHATLTTRVILNEGLFLFAAIWLSVCIWKITHMTSANILLEARGTTVGQACVACVVIILLYVSRTVYNIIAVSWVRCPSFGYTWMNVNDQADLIKLKGDHFVAFGVVLFVWEFLPTFILVIFFRVKRFASRVNVPEVKPGAKTPSKAYFFDNPNRYNSDDDLTKTFSTNDTRHSSINDISSLTNTPQSVPRMGYGALIRSSSYSGQQHPMPGTTPPLLFSSNTSYSGYGSINYD